MPQRQTEAPEHGDGEEIFPPAISTPKLQDQPETAAGEDQLKLLKKKPSPEILKLVPEKMARRYNVLPISRYGNTLMVAMTNTSDIFALEALSAETHMRIKPVAADIKEMREAIDANYKGYSDIEKALARITTPQEATDDSLAITAAIDAPLAEAVNLIIEEAVKARASDIHIEPEDARLRIRYRVDGILHEVMSLPMTIHRAIISRIKILGEMNIADHLRPQDGQISIKIKDRIIDIRVGMIPIVTGEMAVLRLLDKSVATRSLDELGFLPESLLKYQQMLKASYGMILVSGPTGAGKTTTLYASINTIDTKGKNVITIEDPAEYRFEDINQIQINPQAGITFASGLRSILRLDPNVILVGEIRDEETANIAVQAALTGHLLLSSVHANDAAGALLRLIDLHVEPFLISSSVIGVIAQRMVRRICPDCARMVEVPVPEQLAYEKEMGNRQTKFLYGLGCDSCSFTGFRGRVGIFEILPLSDTIKAMIIERVSGTNIRNQAIKEGMSTMMKDGMLKINAGITTPSEVLRTVYSSG
jgi:general secretion pathway protein E